MTFDVSLAIRLLPDLLIGAVTTIGLLIPTFFFGLLISIPIALSRLSANPFLIWPAWAYATFFRGAPLLVILYLVYSGFAMWGMVRDTILWEFFAKPYNCAVFAFSLNHSAFLSEIWRGGLMAVPKGLKEAGAALSLSRPVIFFKILLPLAFRYGLSAYRNEVILFVKATAAVGAITVFDILAFANDAVELTYDPFTPLVMAAAIYWVIVQGFQMVFNRLERYLTRHARLVV